MAVTSRLVNTFSTLKTQTPNIIGNDIQIESFGEETSSTREISIGNALITGGRYTKGGILWNVLSLMRSCPKKKREN